MRKRKFFLLGLFLLFCSKKNELVFQQNLAQEEIFPTRWDSGDTTITNEARLDLYYPFIKNLGGVYIGVGSIQNFTLAAWAKAQSIYLLDFTKIVVLANKIHITFLKEAKSKEEYLSLFQKQNFSQGESILKKEFSEKEFGELQKAYHITSAYFRQYLSQMPKIQKTSAYPVYFSEDSDFFYLQNLAKKGEIFSLAGNLNGEITLKSIAQDIKQKKMQVGILYLSNAEEYFPKYQENFRQNILVLPVDEKSLLLRTLAIEKKNYPWAEGSDILTDRGFHYNLMSLKLFQAFLQKNSENYSLRDLMQKAQILSPGLSFISSQRI